MSAAGAIGAYILVRGLIRLFEQSKLPPIPAPPINPPLLGLPCAAIIRSPPRPVPPGPSIVKWTGSQELLAWRAWRLATFMSQSPHEQSGPRLLSISAPRIWNGPVARTEEPRTETEPPSGIYALKVDVAERNRWEFFDDCWVTGTVALSGRVIEHALGYRAERVVIRELRLGVGTHLRVRSLDGLKRLLDCLETRYQVVVDVGQAEREGADRLITHGTQPSDARMGWVSLKPPWQLI